MSNHQVEGVSKKHRLIRALLSTLRWQFALAIVPRVLLIALKFSQPFLLDRLLTLLNSGESATSSRQAWGMILAFALVYLGIAVCNTSLPPLEVNNQPMQASRSLKEGIGIELLQPSR